jgi:hypothetical protein
MNSFFSIMDKNFFDCKLTEKILGTFFDLVSCKIICLLQNIPRLLSMIVETPTSGFQEQNVHVLLVLSSLRNTCSVRHSGYCRCCWRVSYGIKHCIGCSGFTCLLL